MNDKHSQKLLGLTHNNQAGRDLSITHNYYTKKVESPFNESIKESNKYIYFIYGDSELQSLLVPTRYSEIEYYDRMANSFRMLLTFKPLTCVIVISASSVIESLLTRQLVQEYKCFSEPEKHFSVIRKEATWQDYIEKRRFNTEKLMIIEKYSRYYENEIVSSFNDISVIRKRCNSGIEASENWLKKAKKIVPLIDPNAAKIDIDDIPHEILYDSVFVWDEIHEKIRKRGIIIPNRSDQLQYALVESYLSIFTETCVFPFGDSLSLELPQNYVYFTNVKLLKEILSQANILTDFLELTPLQLLHFINSDELLYFKSKLDSATFESDMLIISKKNKEPLRKAILQSSRLTENKVYQFKSIIKGYLSQKAR